MLTGHIAIPDVIYFRNFNSLPKDLDEIKTTIKTVFERASDYYKDISHEVKDVNLCYRFEIID